MFLGNDTVIILAHGEEITVGGGLVQTGIELGEVPGGRALIKYPVEDGQTVRYEGREYSARDVTYWYDASNAFDHSQIVLEEVAADVGSPD